MKRSKRIALIFMGLALGGCSSDNMPEPKIYTDKAQCVQETGDEAQCEKWLAEAQKQTPRFATKEECEAQFGVGACEGFSPTNSGESLGQNRGGESVNANHSGGSFFMPMMMGFMAGHLLGNAMSPASGFYGNPAQPGVVKDARGATVSRNGMSGLGRALGNARASGVTRSGFSGGGARAAS